MPLRAISQAALRTRKDCRLVLHRVERGFDAIAFDDVHPTAHEEGEAGETGRPPGAAGVMVITSGSLPAAQGSMPPWEWPVARVRRTSAQGRASASETSAATPASNGLSVRSS